LAFLLFAAALVLTGGLAPARASAESGRAVARGAALLAEGAYERALAEFDAALRADRNDAEAGFFRGAALNRLTRYPEAYEALQASRRRGGRNLDMDFELGWSLVGLQRFPEAIRYLEAYEAERPGGARTMEFLGRAYFASGETEKARDAFRQAMARDPQLAPTAHGFLALLARQGGDEEGARVELEQLFAKAPDSDLARRLREKASVDLERPWWLSASLGFGYRDNVIALGEGVPRPPDISHRSSGFAEYTLDAGYRWRLDERGLLIAGYSFLGDLYLGHLPEFDLLDNYFYLEYQRLLTETLAFSLRASDQYTLVGGDSFRNEVALRPALAVQLAPWATGEIAYTVSTSDYQFGAPAVQDRDAVSHSFRAMARLLVPGTRLDLSLGYYVTRSDAHGSDFDMTGHGPILQLGHPLPLGAYGRLTYSHGFDDYDNANSLAGAGFAFKRDDDVDRLRLDLTLPLRDGVELFARYDLTNVGSNIAVFDFDQHSVLGGVTVKF
jgi:tetratricopeptide (TPR) repeat protein